MLAVVLAALATLGAAGDLHLRGEFQATQSVRSLDMETTQDVARAELMLLPRLEAITEGRLRLLLAYAPTLLVPADLAGNTSGLSGSLTERSVLLHRITAGSELALPAWRLQAGGGITTGDTLLLLDPTEGTAPGQPVSTAERIPYFGATLNAAAITELSRRTTLTLTAGVGQSGGADEEARERLPQLQELRVGALSSWSLARRHTLGLDVQVNRSRVAETGDAGFLRMAGIWTHQLSRQVGLRTVTGLAFTYEREDPEHPVDGEGAPAVLPWLEGSVDYLPRGTRPSAHFAVALEPVVDRFVGEVDIRGSAIGTIGWAPFRRWIFGIRGSTAAQFGSGEPNAPSNEPHTIVNAAGISARHELAEMLHLSASVGSTWQLTDREELLEFREDLVMLELSARVFSL